MTAQLAVFLHNKHLQRKGNKQWMRPLPVLSLGQDLSPTEKYELNCSCKRRRTKEFLKLSFAFEKYNYSDRVQ